MKILVTGGAGFIGSHLVKALDDLGHEVIVLDNLSSGKKQNVPRHVKLVKADVERMGTSKKLPDAIDAIFHLAAQIDVRQSVVNPYFDAFVNVLGTIAVLEYARKASAKRFIFSSSGGAIYGAAQSIPTPEDAQTQSTSPYGVAKDSAERYVSLYSRLYGFSTINLRYANVYGEGQGGSKESGVIATFTNQAFLKKPLTIFGDGEQTRDFVHVSDVVNANILALNAQAQGSFNIATGKETTINELAATIKKLLPYELEIVYEKARKGEERRSCLDYTAAKNVLGWQPKIDLKKGLEMTYRALM